MTSTIGKPTLVGISIMIDRRTFERTIELFAGMPEARARELLEVSFSDMKALLDKKLGEALV